MICVDIDDLTPCLTDNETGDIVETEVLKVTRKSFLSKFNQKTGWYENWSKLVDENEIYALVVKGTVDIQGMIAIKADYDMGCLFLSWAVAAPHNNREIVNVKKYNGVGGHLLAIAAQKAFDYGFHGDMTGYAMDEQLLHYYCDTFGAEHIGMLHPYQIGFDKITSNKLLEVYTYEWSDDEL